VAARTPVTAVLLAVALGWCLDRVVGRPADRFGPVTGTVLWAIAAGGGWLSLLALAGIAWRPWLLVLPWLLTAPAAFLRPGRTPTRPAADLWALATAVVVAPRAFAVALTPAYGWDFRYLWGLKAEVFAAARGIDLTWLAWQPLAELHPSYPPLWPELLATGPLLGERVASIAAAWGAVLVVGLAAAGWDATRDLPRPLRALVASCLAWAPVLFRPDRSGYAEPLVAFLLVVALVAVAAAAEKDGRAPVVLAVAAPALALAKNEGAVLAAACVVAALVVVRRRAVPAVIATAGSIGLWRAVVVFAALPRPGAVHELDVLVERSLSLPSALATALTPALGWLLLAWALLLPALLDRRVRAPGAVLLLWVGAAATAYLTTPWGLAWHLAWSLDRVVAVAFPAALAVTASALLRAPAAPPAPGSAPGG